jgi:hypothetical protein
MKLQKIKDFGKSFGLALLGETDPKRNIPHVNIRRIDTIVSDLVKIKDAQWSEYAFSREPVKEKFSTSDRKELAERAAFCGRKNAKNYIDRFGTSQPSIIAEKMSIQVTQLPEPKSGNRVLFAEYCDPDEIHIFSDGVTRGEALLERPGILKTFGGGFSIYGVLLGHELFHAIESRDEQRIWTKTYETELWKLGKWAYKSHVACLSEIAAMSFTQYINQLSWSPYVMDAFLVYGYSPMAASALYEEMMISTGLKPRL